ncbi:F-box/WD repeat-containing protein 12 isoform X3 [Zalophus californianus]|uniref:F-box/WD repeat-containing protein 12 isoform X3 n=1 Tax=Zalophus californianus TaxID=9704 RepID=A0A6P9FD08_ZALCA|nr:F-box/WD repeat-containing protein 12 isoform X3 [Zalophus californianus]
MRSLKKPYREGLCGEVLRAAGSQHQLASLMSQPSWTHPYEANFNLGTMIWSSPVQQSSIVRLATLPQLHLAFTADLEGTVKVWNCQDEDALATLTMPRACFSLESCLTNDGPFLMDFLSPSIDVVVVFGFRACWAPRRTGRITVMYRRGSFKKTGFTTFELMAERTGDRTDIQVCGLKDPQLACTCMFCMKTAHQIATFLLPLHMESPIWMGVGDGNMIVFESGPSLFLFTISGHLLQRFEDHQRTIGNLWVDSVHVLTTSMDDSLHLYMWEEEGHYPYLRSCCHLEHLGSDPAPSCYVSKAVCDDMSIVCVVSRIRESSILVMYSLHM